MWRLLLGGCLTGGATSDFEDISRILSMKTFSELQSSSGRAFQKEKRGMRFNVISEK
jgi:hypothetical protein